MEHESKFELPLPPASTPLLAGKLVEQRKQKKKTRPSHSSIDEIVTPAELSGAEEPAPPPQTFKIDVSTAGVLLRLFSKSQAPGSVS